MNIRVESAAGFQGGGFEVGNAGIKAQEYSSVDEAAAKDVAADEPATPPSPQRVAAIAEKSITAYPKLVGPEAPASLLFEASLAITAKKRSVSDNSSAHIDFPRMINRRWVPSPSQLHLVEEAKLNQSVNHESVSSR